MIEVIIIISIFLNMILLAKVSARDKLITIQHNKIKELVSRMNEWQRVHSKCTDVVCMDQVLEDIIGDM